MTYLVTQLSRGLAQTPLGIVFCLACAVAVHGANPADYPGSVANPDGTYTYVFRPSGGANDGSDLGGLASGKDAFVLNNEDSRTGRTNNGAANYTHHFNSNCNAWWGWSYYQWDVSALPPADEVVQVVLVLRQRIVRGYAWGYQTPVTEMVVRAPAAPWNEMTLTYVNRPAIDPTVLARANLATDRMIPGVVTPPAQCWFDGYVRVDITALYRDWQSGARPNHGIVYQRDQKWCENANANYVYTSDNADPLLRPALEITYHGSVADTEPPVLTVPGALEAEATGPGGAVVDFTASALDAQDGAVPVTLSPAPGTVFPLGTTTVTATAEDAAGNVATAAFTVTVRDTTPPAITRLAATPALLWPANHRLVAVALSAASADLVDPAPRMRIVAVQSNEPVNGTGDGDTAPDWAVTGDLRLELRAERAGNGSGRSYTIVVESCDASGNATSGTVTVFVPKSAGKN